MTFPPASVQGLRITVLGAARSGLAAAALLKENGARVFVSDVSPADKMRDADATLRRLDVAHEFGRHTGKVFDCDVIVISPGIPDSSPVVQEAIRRESAVVSELECASWFCRGPIVAITGTNGKTTTTELLGRILSDARKPMEIAGNIGKAFSSVVAEMREDTIGVLEVSSFQLDHIRSFHPSIAVLLNVTPDHIDRYNGSFERYAASKARVTERQKASDSLIYNADDEWSVRIAGSARCKTVPFSTERVLTDGAWVEDGKLMSTGAGSPTAIIDIGQLSIPGRHNLSNAMAAVLAAQNFGVSPASIRATLRNFKGVEHRIEFVRELNGVKYFNDSKATNVDSVVVALKAFTEPVVLLLGGRDKGNDYDAIKELVREKVKSIVAIGESSAKVFDAFSNVVRVVKAGSMEEAVQSANGFSGPGDVVLLSPACASYDWFKNYEHRGRVFKELVRAL